MKNKAYFFTIFINFLFILTIFVVDIHAFFGHSIWLLYIIPLLVLSAHDITILYILSVSALETVFITIKFLMTFDPFDPGSTIFSASLYIITIWTIAYLQIQRKKANTRLNESEVLFRSTFEQSYIGTGHIGENLKYLRLNRRYCDILGYTREELYARTFHDITYAEDLEKELPFFHKLQNGEIESYSIEKRFILKNGRLLWCLNTKSRAYDSEGNFRFFISTIEDISVRKKYEEALKESEERFRRAVEDSPIPIMIHAEDGQVVLVNQAWTELSGYSLQDIPTISEWTRKAYGNRKEELESYIKGLYQIKGRNLDLELNIITRDGRQLIWQFYSAPLGSLPDQRRIVISMAIDMTNRRIMEENLRQSEESFRLLADSLPQIVWSTDPDGWVAYYNKRWTEFTGLGQEGSSGWEWTDRVHPEDKQKASEAWQKAISSGQNYEIECRLKGSDDNYCWFLSRAIPMKEGSKIIKWFGSSTNINDQKITLQRLEKTLKELERSNTELEQFAYVASHDLQEPLRMMHSYAELLEKRYKGKLDESADDFLKFITDGAKRMQHLINDLLQYSRVSTRGKPFEHVDCMVVLSNVLDNLQISIEESGARITYDNLPIIHADETQFVQLFQNLLNNSIKFRAQNPPQIHISAEEKKQEWVFSVKDNGIGIDPEFYERVFIIFQRLHTSDRYPGTGIGLAVCKKIVERHQGKIWVESEINKGTTFYFTIPKR